MRMRKTLIILMFISGLVARQSIVYFYVIPFDNLKDDNKNFVDSIGAGDTYLAGLISSLLLNMGDLPSMIYADVVAHISTTRLGTLKEVPTEEADEKYLNVKTSLTDMEDVLYVHRTFDDD